MKVIIIHAEEAWDYYTKNEAQLSNTLQTIAYNDEFGVTIYLTVSLSRLPEVVVYMDGIRVRSVQFYSKRGMQAGVEEIYETYLTDRAVSAAIEEENAQEERERAIAAREDELDSAVISLLDVLLGDDYHVVAEDFNTIAEGLKEHVCEWIYKEHDVSIYRPMYLEDEEGKEFFEEYPYECIIDLDSK